jgi:hypothetical protein
MISRARGRQWDFVEKRLPRKTPRGGDIVITCVGRPPLVYRVSETTGMSGTTFAEYDDALRLARAWALRAHVDVWFAEETEDVLLVARHRPDGD